MQAADRLIALAIMALSAYFMIHASALPIGWNGKTGGPGAGAFPFWLSLVMAIAAAGVLLRSLLEGKHYGRFFHDRAIVKITAVTFALFCTIALISFAGAYIALVLFMLWYLKFYGRHGWVLTLSLILGTPIFLFFFFEVTLKILLPKGFTEPLFFPLYAMFF